MVQANTKKPNIPTVVLGTGNTGLRAIVQSDPTGQLVAGVGFDMLTQSQTVGAKVDTQSQQGRIPLMHVVSTDPASLDAMIKVLQHAKQGMEEIIEHQKEQDRLNPVYEVLCRTTGDVVTAGRFEDLCAQFDKEEICAMINDYHIRYIARKA